VLEPDEVQVKLLGEPGRIDARGLQRALASLLDVLESFDDADVRARWAITNLAVASAALAVRPVGVVLSETREGLDTFLAGVDRLDSEAGVPEGWDERAVRRMIDMASVANLDGVEGVELSWGDHPPVRLDHAVLANSEESVTERHLSLGSVRGRLDRYYHRGSKREVGLLDEVTGEAIKVQFGAHLQQRVVDAMEHTVTAWGELHRSADGRRLRLRLEDFEVEAPESLPVPVEHLAGVLGEDWTEGVSSVEWARAQRGESADASEREGFEHGR
jgi:hypothetical protein